MFALIASCLLAPLPAPKEQPPLPLKEAIVGRFVLHWGGATYDCEIDRDHCWDCRGGSTRWIGGVEVRGDRVILSEAVLDPLTLTTGEERHYEVGWSGSLDLWSRTMPNPSELERETVAPRTFAEQLEIASRIVATWPAWKRNILVNMDKPTVDVPRTPIFDPGTEPF